MFLAKLSIKRPVTITMVLLVFIIFGAMAYFGLPLNMMPDIDIPVVTIQVVYPGAGPAELETQVTDKIEAVISTISGIDYTMSYSMENVAFVMLMFDVSKDINIANQEVKDKIDTIINDLPGEAEKPIVQKLDMGSMPVVKMALAGTLGPLELFEYADKTLNDRLSQLDGVASVSITGGQKREIQINFTERNIFANELSILMISQILAAHNLNVPAGAFRSGNQEISVKVQGEFADVETLREIEVPTAFGRKKLGQIATVIDTGAEMRERSTLVDMGSKTQFDNVVSLELLKTPDGNPVKISKAMHKILPGIQKELPEGMDLLIVDDRSDMVRSSVNDTMSNIYMGIILTGLVLLIFLHDIRSTIIVALSMPISIISTMLLLQVAGFSLNIMSLLGLSTSIGVLVANSIVVLENIFNYKSKGLGRKESAEKGTSEIAVAVLASTLTNIVVFLPIGTMGGILGMIFKQFGLTVVFATLFSLLTSFTLTPMLASIILPATLPKPNQAGIFIEKCLGRLNKFYAHLLSFVIKSKKMSLLTIVATVLLLVFSLKIATTIGFEFMPMLDEGNINMTVELPVGYSLNETAETLTEIEAELQKFEEVEFILTNLGVGGRIDRGLNMATTSIKLVDVKERELSTHQVADKMIRAVSHIPNAKILIQAQSSVGPGGGGSAIELIVKGTDGDRLLNLTEEIVEKIKDIPGLVNLDTSARSGKPEITIIPKRDQLSLTGNTVTELAMGVRGAIEGLVTTQYREAGNEYDIRLTMKEEEYNTPEKLRNLTIVTSSGTYLLSQLADVDFSESVNKITHRDKTKTISILGDPALGVPIGDVTAEINKRVAQIEFPEGYSPVYGGMAANMQAS
ncbi:MAG: efflux RND transporter permease subunit, partial [Candidatus Cloacimonetes bacterium]|nr:efflux RND transporter permease subunit [Candidatus Cloacimonadota bacterium]